MWKFLAENTARGYISSQSRGFNASDSKKNILFLIPWLTFGGAEKVNLEILEALKKDGWNIFIVTTKEARHEWEDKFRVYTNNILHIETIPQKLHSYIFLELINRYEITLTFISNSFTGYMATPHLSQVTTVVDLVHSEGGKEDKGGTPAFSATFNNYISKRVVISDRLKKLYVEKYAIEPSKISVIRNGVDDEEIKSDVSGVKLDEGIEKFLSRDKRVTWGGRLSYEKQPKEVLYLAKQMPDFNFILVGGGELYNEILADAKGIDNLLVTGELSNNQLKAVISKSDLTILTSQFEGIPMIILESMALGKLVVSTDVGAISEIIEDGIDGFLCDPEKIQDEMPVLIKSAYKKKNIIQEKAIEKIRSKFNKANMQSQYLNLFNGLTKQD